MSKLSTFSFKMTSVISIILYICSEILTVLDFCVQLGLARGRTCHSLKGPCRNKTTLFNNAFQNICRFLDKRGQTFAVFVCSISYSITYDLNNGVIRSRLL